MCGDSSLLNDLKSMFVLVCADGICASCAREFSRSQSYMPCKSLQLDLQKGTYCKASATNEMTQICLNCMLEPSTISFFFKGVPKVGTIFSFLAASCAQQIGSMNSRNIILPLGPLG